MSKKRTKKNQKMRKIKKYLLISFCTIQTVAIALLAIYIFNINRTSNESKKDDYFKYENFVFLGDSITDWYPFEDFYSSDVPIINSGFAGYTSEELLKDMDKTVYQYNPTKVFIQVGTNDLNCDNPDTEKILKNITRIINNVKKNRPNSEVYLESIYPINKTDDEKINKGCVGKRENIDIVSLNEKLEEYCNNNDVVYIDLYDELSDDRGDLKLEYTTEGLHLSREGYQVVSKILKQYLKEKKDE